MGNKELEKFKKLANEKGEIIGTFSNQDFEGSLALLDEFKPEELRFEFFLKGQTIARCYWEDKEISRSGCISIPDF